MDANPVQSLEFMFSKSCFDKHAHQPSVFFLRWFNWNAKKLHVDAKFVTFFPHGLEPQVLFWLEGTTSAYQKVSPVVDTCLQRFMCLTHRLVLLEIKMQDVCVVNKENGR